MMTTTLLRRNWKDSYNHWMFKALLKIEIWKKENKKIKIQFKLNYKKNKMNCKRQTKNTKHWNQIMKYQKGKSLEMNYSQSN